MIGGVRNLRRGAAQHPRLRTVLRYRDQLRDKKRVVARRGTPNRRALDGCDDGYRCGAAKPCRNAIVPRGICGDCSYPARSRDHHR
jgi:hypothetical protein